eukprot:CAMPEP_0113513514 /NCGR_PEP_ID=MMETSP0014_2-20120614/39911_1 /TAXON_ID=2857 /ORGANISM="Nitzschia sp." /LENGTH=396 /DNA_ID=CAMNT_0000409939 /DNA_START=197 /DNA_END=1387 /DNA_ORIENTATION=+ /assembly_acc=CAM_ASM_000159
MTRTASSSKSIVAGTFTASPIPTPKIMQAASTASTGASSIAESLVSTDGNELGVSASASASASASVSSTSSHAGQHKELKRFSVVDTSTLQEIVPNAEPIVIDNECFSGHVMLLVRTPDVDDPKEPVPTLDSARRISKYFKEYKRRFEFQFQIKLKKVPTGPLFLGCEVEEMVKISRFTKGLAGVLLAMIRRINSGFHYSWGLEHEKTSKEDIEAGRYESTHLSFPVEASMDRIVITKPGEEPPKLGYALHETNASVKRRRRMGAGSVDWNTEDTFTMCLWSAYCDWIKWKSMNVPGVRPFSLGIVTGQQPIYLSVYELKDISPEEYRRKKPDHKKCDLKVYTRLEFSHREMTNKSLNSRLQNKGPIDSLDDSLGDTDSEVETMETSSVNTDGKMG